MPQRKKFEEKVVRIFEKKLSDIGIKIEIDPNISDKPDLAFTYEKKKIGCELTTLTLQEFEHWARKPGDLNAIKTLNINNLPTLWATNAISKKNLKIDSYNPSKEYAEVWLLLHTGDLPAFNNDPNTIKWFRWISAKINHNFDAIWFLGEEEKLVRLNTKGQRRLKKPKNPKYDLITHRAVTVKLGHGVTTVDLGDSAPLNENNSKRSQLLRGAYFGDLLRVMDCLNRGVDINYRNNIGCSALRYAAGQGHINIVEYLLLAGAGQDDEISSIINICEIRKYSTIVEEIKSHFL